MDVGAQREEQVRSLCADALDLLSEQEKDKRRESFQSIFILTGALGTDLGKQLK